MDQNNSECRHFLRSFAGFNPFLVIVIAIATSMFNQIIGTTVTGPAWKVVQLII